MTLKRVVMTASREDRWVEENRLVSSKFKVQSRLITEMEDFFWNKEKNKLFFKITKR